MRTRGLKPLYIGALFRRSKSRSYADARIETLAWLIRQDNRSDRVPMRTRGLKHSLKHRVSLLIHRVPMRTRGLKPVELRGNANTTTSRSYADARIETPCGARGLKHNKV